MSGLSAQRALGKTVSGSNQLEGRATASNSRAPSCSPGARAIFPWRRLDLLSTLQGDCAPSLRYSKTNTGSAVREIDYINRRRLHAIGDIETSTTIGAIFPSTLVWNVHLLSNQQPWTNNSDESYVGCRASSYGAISSCAMKWYEEHCGLRLSR